MPYYSYSLIAKNPKGILVRQDTILNMEVFVNHEGQPTIRELVEPALYHFDNLTIEDVINRYMMIAIERCPDCEGCRCDSKSQQDHYDCNTGCLHVKEKCEICNP